MNYSCEEIPSIDSTREKCIFHFNKISAMNIDKFSEIAVRNGAHSSEKNLATYLKVLFKGIDFNGKSFLDIGGGSGLFTHYASTQGTSRAICMEPVDDGAYENITAAFESVKNEVKASGVVELDNSLFQEYEGEPFDIVLLHNSINHLDEEACVEVLESQEARDTYVGLFDKLYDLVTPGGIVIICDCGRRNFFADLGMTNPVMKDIEWEKHQQPKVWGKLMEKSGFKIESIKWNTFNTLGKVGQVFLGHSLPSYFTLSHFRLYLSRPKS